MVQAKRMRQTCGAQSPEKKCEFKCKQELNTTIGAAVEVALTSGKKRECSNNERTNKSNAFENVSVSSDGNDSNGS